MSRSEAVRFGVGEAEGPRSSIWRLWIPDGKSDVYIGARSVSAAVKASLHSSGICQVGLTSSYAEDSEIDPNRRLWTRWRMPESGPGYSIPLALYFPLASLRAAGPALGSPGKPFFWIEPDFTKEGVEVGLVFVAEPLNAGEWPGKSRLGTTPLVSYDLPNGKQFWLVATAVNMSDDVRDKLASAKARLRNRVTLGKEWDLANIRGFWGASTPSGTHLIIEFAGDEVLESRPESDSV